MVVGVSLFSRLVLGWGRLFEDDGAPLSYDKSAQRENSYYRTHPAGSSVSSSEINSYAAMHLPGTIRVSNH